MPAADKYLQQRFTDFTKNKPKVATLATPRFTPTSIFAGRPSDPVSDPDAALQGGLAGATSQVTANPYSSLFLFKKRI